MTIVKLQFSGGRYSITIPDAVIRRTAWCKGTELLWTQQPNGIWQLQEAPPKRTAEIKT